MTLVLWSGVAREGESAKSRRGGGGWKKSPSRAENFPTVESTQSKRQGLKCEIIADLLRQNRRVGYGSRRHPASLAVPEALKSPKLPLGLPNFDFESREFCSGDLACSASIPGEP